MTDKLLVGGVNAVFIGVSDLQSHLDLYVGQLGWSVTEEGRLLAAQTSLLWGGGIADIEFTVLAAAGAAHGRLVLLQVADQGSRPHPWQADTGFIGINMYTRDIEVSHTELSAVGHTWIAPPATWRVPLGEQIVTVTEGFLRAPESTDIVFVQPAVARGTAAWDADPDRHYTELTSVVCHVPNFEAEAAFWGTDGLGLDCWYDVSFTDPGLDAMANLPDGTVMRLAFLAGATTARIEVTRIEDRTLGSDLRSVQRTARHMGHSGWLMEVYDLDVAVARAVALGGSLHSAPHPGPQPLFDGRPVAFLDTPNGLPITFVQTAG